MSLKKYLFASFVFASTMIYAQEPANMTGMVDRHNYWRAEFDLPKVTWSAEIAQNAQKWADYLQTQGCILKHSSDKYGENIFWASGGTITPKYVTDNWADERANYDFTTYTCKPGQVCGHYTQIIWENTKEIGCAMAKCGTQEIWVCQYNPPGNYIGQRPYVVKP